MGTYLQSDALLSLAAEAAAQHRAQNVLDVIVNGLAGQNGVGLARIWLRPHVDSSSRAPTPGGHAGDARRLRLVASAGDWHPRSIPFDLARVEEIATTNNSILVKDSASQHDWIAPPDWADRHEIRAFVGHSLISSGKSFGVLAIATRVPLDEQDWTRVGMFVGQVAVAIANAQAFEELAQAEAAMKQHAEELRQVMDVVPQHMFIMESNLMSSFWNRAGDEYFGHATGFLPMEFARKFTHPDDAERYIAHFEEAFRTGAATAVEARMRGKDGKYRWFFHQVFPLRDENGRIARWCGTRIDIEDRKQAQELVERENLELREEIDKASMFEEIVGSSPALQAVLARVARVANTDSTVLVTGETGTGKELIARAIHKHSPRSARAFVSVNCAAIPRDLVASDLFGHEKGAFTGALQRRLGRFELAEGGTIFLDEMGELPAETQVTLLRVLQEREFQRVGGSTSIRADVRVIAATNRDLPEAVAAGTFRSDLYYRINVFPIAVPSLRERREDIPLLVEYFIARYSSQIGKKIRHIDRKTLDRLQSYSWPGNIRELQNVIERSVILCDGEEFSVDENWLSHEVRGTRILSDDLAAQEKKTIEAALGQTKGRVSGASGAAALLGMPASTLDSKIKTLKIDKRRFQSG